MIYRLSGWMMRNSAWVSDASFGKEFSLIDDGAEDEPDPPKVKSKASQKSKPAPPEIDRSGELSEGAMPQTQPHPAKPEISGVSSGLAAVDLSAPAASRTNSSSRFDYVVDEEEKRVEQVDTPLVGDVEVVRVKRKKKKVKEGREII